MRPLLILLCLASTAVGEDYRWRMLGENGEEFGHDDSSAVPHISENDGSTDMPSPALTYNSTYRSIPCTGHQVVPQFDSYADVGPEWNPNLTSMVAHLKANSLP
ncbi:MAG: hypothetical protein R3E01_02710 [Pirellulaceae bacterium]